MADDVSDAVRELVHRRLPSMDHIELLLLLARHPERIWTAELLAAELRRDRTPVARDAEELVRSGVVSAVGADAERRYLFNPADPALHSAVAQLMELYQRRPVTLVRLIYSRPSKSIVSFSDAFRLRKPEE